MSKPYTPTGTQRRFHVPRTLAADFTEFQDNDIPNTVMNFECIHDWYDKLDTEHYSPRYVRGEQYPDSTKSRYQNTDNNMNIRCDINSGIRKGDIMIDENGYIYLLDWHVALQSNNAPSRALRCNFNITIKRWHQEETDADGYLVKEAGYDTIVDSMPVNGYRYEGRPEYSAVSDMPGITPNALTLVTLQYNSHSNQIHEGDIFTWGDESYIVVDVSRMGVSLDESCGCLTLQARKEPGGTGVVR